MLINSGGDTKNTAFTLGLKKNPVSILNTLYAIYEDVNDWKDDTTQISELFRIMFLN